MHPETFIWQSAVRKEDLDIQNIVNNAVYLQYFDQARIAFLLSKNIDWVEWHKNGFNFVLIHTDMAIKKSLRADDQFYVKSTYEKVGRLKIVFHQTIYKMDDTLIATAKNTIVCVAIAKNKPVMPPELLTIFPNKINQPHES